MNMRQIWLVIELNRDVVPTNILIKVDKNAMKTTRKLLK